MNQKLDQSVFEHMPDWAQWAALQPEGKVAFSDRPMVLESGNWWRPHDDAQWFVQEWPQVDFARDDWQNSLIERKGGGVMAKKLIDAIDALASELSTRRGMDQYLVIQAMILEARHRERHTGLLAMNGAPFKTVTAAKACRSKLPAGTEFDPALFGVYAVEGGFVLRRYERDGLGWGAIDPGWVGEDAAEAERQRTTRRAAFMAARNLTEDEHGNFVELEEQ